MKLMATKWHSMTMDEYDVAHKSYADAVHYVQCNLDVPSSRRPKRLGPGIYQLTGFVNRSTGRQSQYYIATQEAAKREGFEFPELG